MRRPEVTLLLVADQSRLGATRLLLEQQAQKAVSVVATASNAAAALESARQLQPDAAIVDLGIVGCSPLDLIQSLRRLLPKSVIIAIAADVGGAMSRPALKVGADAFVAMAKLEATLIPALLRGVDARLRADAAVRGGG